MTITYRHPLAENTLKLSEFAWPITYRWHIQSPFGVYVSSLSVNAPQLEDQAEAAHRYGQMLYQGTVATATCRSSHPFIQEMVQWKVSDVPSVSQPSGIEGHLFGLAAPRDQTGVLVLHTGHADGRGRRRLYLGGMPRSWSLDGLLTVAGAEGLQTLGRSIINGLVAGSGPLPAELLVAYPYSVPVSGPIGREVSFRRVSHIRVCQHTARTPDLAQGIWPSPD